MARNEKFTAPAPSVEKGEDSGRPGPLKKLVLASIAVGTAFNTAACSAEDWESPRPTATVTVTETATPSAAPEAATSEVGKEQSDIEIKPTPEELQRAAAIVVPKVLSKLEEFEKITATKPRGISSDEEVLWFFGDRSTLPVQGEGQVEVEEWGHLYFSLKHEIDGGTRLTATSERWVGCIRDGEYNASCRDEVNSEIKDLVKSHTMYDSVEFYTSESHLSEGKLDAQKIRDILEGAELQVMDISSRGAGESKRAWIDEGGLLQSYDLKDDDTTSSTDDKPVDIMEELLNKCFVNQGK